MATELSAETLKQGLPPETVKEYYDELRAPLSGSEPEDFVPKIPARWTDQDWMVAHGFLKRVAQASTLEEFDHFLRTGESIVPVKMTPAEMEVMMGGGPIANWVGAVGAAATVAAAAGCCSNN